MEKWLFVMMLFVLFFAHVSPSLAEQESVDVIIKRCESGDVEECLHLSEMYYVGNDLMLSVKYAEKASDWGSEIGSLNAGSSYFNGRAVKKDDVKAAKYLNRAAISGNTSAMVLLGNLYHQGSGVEKDVITAFYLWGKAAELGNKSAVQIIERFKEIAAEDRKLHTNVEEKNNDLIKANQARRMPVNKLPVNLVLPQSLQEKVEVVGCRNDGGSWRCVFRNISNETINLGGYSESGYDVNGIRIDTARTVRNIIAPGEAAEHSFAQSGYAGKVTKIVVGR